MDAFKSSLTLLGLTLQLMFSDLPPGVYFTLINQSNSDLHQLIKKNVCGGLRIVFHREHQANVTYIRHREFGDNAKLCKKILGYDANSLYLRALKRAMPTGHFIRYQSESDFKPSISHRTGLLAMQWLELVGPDKQVQIQHKYNGGEVRIGPRQLPVDGYCAESKTVFQFHGCWYHGHHCDYNTDKRTNQIKRGPGNREAEGLQADTQEKSTYLRGCVENLVEIHECEWMHQRETSATKFIEGLKTVKPKYDLTQEKIIRDLQNGKLFDMLLCDIETPEELKPKFEEFCPIFKNTMVSRDDIAEHMHEYAERNNVFKKPHRILIGSYFGKDILLITPLVKWYLDHDLKVTKVYEFIEYYPSKCFEQFGLNVSEARRAGDSEPSKAVLAESQKLHGNSSCGKCLTNKQKHREAHYCNRSEVSKLINSRVFHRLNVITDDLYEVECLKKSVKEDLPLQISYFVYGYAKLRMLEFYFDFLLHFIDRQDFQCVQSDTDSLYMTFSGGTLADCVKPHMRREYFENLHHWLPLDVCDRHRADDVETQCTGKPWSPQQCCIDQFKYDRRTPMLFKQEWVVLQSWHSRVKLILDSVRKTSKCPKASA